MKRYCPHCFKATEYTSRPPEVCSFCNKKYVGVSNANIQINNQRPSQPTPPSNPVKSQPIIDDDDDDSYIDVNQLPTIDKIEISIDAPLRPERRVFENIAGKGKLGTARPRNPSMGKKKSKKQIHQEWAEQFKKRNNQGND